MVIFNTITTDFEILKEMIYTLFNNVIINSQLEMISFVIVLQLLFINTYLDII